MDKTRHQWTPDFYSCLQLEIISFYVRYRLYNRKRERKKCADICNMKWSKISNLSKRNFLANLVNDKKVYNKYIHKWLGDGFGFPHFYYSNINEHEYRYWDAKHYFSITKNVEYQGDEWIIDTNYVKTEELILNQGDRYVRVPYTDVKGPGEQLLVNGYEQFREIFDR